MIVSLKPVRWEICDQEVQLISHATNSVVRVEVIRRQGAVAILVALSNKQCLSLPLLHVLAMATATYSKTSFVERGRDNVMEPEMYSTPLVR